MVTDFDFEAPEVVKKIKDVQTIYDMNNTVNALEGARNVHNDMFVKTATEYGIERYEQEYDLTPLGTDTSDDLRNRVLAKKNDYVPYTERTLRRKLDALCGGNLPNGLSPYVLTVDCENMHVELRLRIPRKKFLEQAREMLEEIVPLNMSLNVETMYNTHDGIHNRYTHDALEEYPATHIMIREEIET